MPKKTFFKLPEEKQKRILDAAAEEFTEYKDNYKKSSVNRIAERADIAIGSIYKYFYDKNDLFFYLFNCNSSRPESLSAAGTFYDYSLKEVQTEERLTPLGEILLKIIFANSDLFQDLIFQSRVEDEYLAVLCSQMQKDEDRGLVQKNTKKDIAAYLYSTLEYIAYQYCQQNQIDFSQDEEVLKEMTELFFFGLYRDGVEDKIR